MSKPTDEQIQAFLTGLAALSERTRVVVTGCTDGACHCSMSLRDADDRSVAHPIRYTFEFGCGPVLAEDEETIPRPVQHGGEEP